jgi:hypothetical protein
MTTVVAEISKVEFPKLQDRIDDLPPTTVITHVQRNAGGNFTVRGSTADNGTVRRVVVNGQEARALPANFAEWEVTLSGVAAGRVQLSAHAEDPAGNVEPRPHVIDY